jgi:hypothetical protein
VDDVRVDRADEDEDEDLLDDARRRPSQRDVGLGGSDSDLGGRDLVSIGRAAIAADPGAAETMLTAAFGSSDPAVRGEAAAALGATAAERARRQNKS